MTAMQWAAGNADTTSEKHGIHKKTPAYLTNMQAEN